MLLTGEIPAKGDWITHRYSPSLCHIRASTRKHRKNPLQVEVLYCETYPHLLSLGSQFMGAQAQVVAYSLRNLIQHICSGKKPLSFVNQGPLVCDLGATHHASSIFFLTSCLNLS